MTDLMKQSVGLPKLYSKNFNSEEAEVIRYYLSKPKQFKDYTQSDKQKLGAYLIKMAQMMGVKEPIAETELIFMVKMLVTEFKTVSGLELDKAIKMALTGKLLDKQGEPLNKHYNSFNIIFITNIIIAYKEHRSKVIIKYNRMKQRAELDAPKKPPSKEEIFDMGFDLLMSEYNEYENDPQNYTSKDTYLLKYMSMYRFLLSCSAIKALEEESNGNAKDCIINFFESVKRGDFNLHDLIKK